MSVLLWATEPVLILLLARFVLGERIGVLTATAVAIAMVGVVLVVHSPGVSGAATGIALSLAAVTACAFYSVLTRRMLLDDSSLTVVLAQQLTALACAVAVTGPRRWYGRRRARPAHGRDDLGARLPFRNGLLRLRLLVLRQRAQGVPAATAGSLLPLIPVFGLAASHALGERLGAQQWVGAAIVVGATTVVAARHVLRRP